MTRRPQILTHARFVRPGQLDGTQRELNAVREIMHAFVNADRPEEVFQFALDRTGPLIGASLASVYLVEGASELMRMVAAYNWPEQHRSWLGEMRVRVGFGPSGEAAAERRAIEVPDVASDGGMEDWAEVGKELGFRSLVALPLKNAKGALGAVTFYFDTEGAPTRERRHLMSLVADQLAAAAEKATLVTDLRRATAAMTDLRDELDRQPTRHPEAAHADLSGSHLNPTIAQPLRQAWELLRGPTRTSAAAVGDVERTLAIVLARLDDAEERRTLATGGVVQQLERCTVGDLVSAASLQADDWVGGEGVLVATVAEGAIELVTDRRTMVRVLASLLVFAGTRGTGIPVHLRVSVEGDALVVTIRDGGGGGGLTREHAEEIFSPFAPPGVTRRGQASPGLARELVLSLGGSLSATPIPGQGLQFMCTVPLRTSPHTS